MHSQTLLFIASAALALASPISRRQGGCGTPQPAVPVLPLTGGDKELAMPAANLTLKAIALGFGIQNYTCSEAGATPAAAGALAMLYDITGFYPDQSPESLSLEDFNALTTTSIWGHEVPLNFEESVTEDRIASSVGASPSNPFRPDAPLQLDGMAPIPFLGHHLFDTSNNPVFRMPQVGIEMIATRLDSTNAPTNADRGPEDTGAVAWLALGALPGTTGAEVVYRVLTAGGVSHGCAEGAGRDSTSYTATYWFYG